MARRRRRCRAAFPASRRQWRDRLLFWRSTVPAIAVIGVCFVAKHLIGASIESLSAEEEFLGKSKPGDFLVATRDVETAGVEKIRQTPLYTLYGLTH